MYDMTVIVPVYRVEQYLRKCLDSLVNQTLRPDEFILVCDGELTPDLEIVIEKYQKQFPNVLRVFRKENGGLGKALNYGLQRCRYPIVARADSDDVCAPNRFERQMRFLDEHPEIGIISS